MTFQHRQQIPAESRQFPLSHKAFTAFIFAHVLPKRTDFPNLFHRHPVNHRLFPQISILIAERAEHFFLFQYCSVLLSPDSQNRLIPFIRNTVALPGAIICLYLKFLCSHSLKKLIHIPAVDLDIPVLMPIVVYGMPVSIAVCRCHDKKLCQRPASFGKYLRNMVKFQRLSVRNQVAAPHGIGKGHDIFQHIFPLASDFKFHPGLSVADRHQRNNIYGSH